MNYWILPDPHFGHTNLIKLADRPVGFEHLILKHIYKTIKEDDVLILLGDFCIRNDIDWHDFVMPLWNFKKWLIKGNHDKKSNTWYLNHGWDFVGDSINLKVFGLNILLSHKPQKDNGYDINIHGHFHNSNHRRDDPESLEVKNDKQKPVMLEHHYMPQNLRYLVGK